MSLTPAKMTRLSDKHAAQEQEARKEGETAPVLKALKKAVKRAKKTS
jgi:hypothetical protein